MSSWTMFDTVFLVGCEFTLKFLCMNMDLCMPYFQYVNNNQYFCNAFQTFLNFISVDTSFK